VLHDGELEMLNPLERAAHIVGCFKQVETVDNGITYAKAWSAGFKGMLLGLLSLRGVTNALRVPRLGCWFTSSGGDEPHYLLAASQVHTTCLSTCYQAIQMQIDLLYVQVPH
jgi:hypothetical protein